MPTGADVTVPLPEPAIDTLSVAVVATPKVAVTVADAVSVTWHAPAPEQAPLQPENEEPPEGLAVSVTCAPCVNEALHVPEEAPPEREQEIPAGFDVTVPAPTPLSETVRTGFPPAEQLALATQPPLQKIWDSWHAATWLEQRWLSWRASHE
jgi:hypothetical protein